MTLQLCASYKTILVSSGTLLQKLSHLQYLNGFRPAKLVAGHWVFMRDYVVQCHWDGGQFL